MKRLAYIALGSNLPSPYGSPQETLKMAVNRLAALGGLVALSSLYETDPAGRHDQPVFFNAVAAIECDFTPRALLQHMLALEAEFGRVRDANAPKGPRTLDLDLLLMGDLVVQASGLTLPHPALAGRRFVLTPLAEIAPQLQHPILHRSIAQLLEALPDEGENRIAAVRLITFAGWKGPSSPLHADE